MREYYHLDNDGLLNGNEALASGTSHNLYQFHGGISVFF